MAAGNKIGASVKVEGDILSPMFGSIVLEIPEGENAEHLLEGSAHAILGKTTDESVLR